MKDVSIVLCPYKNNGFFKKIINQIYSTTDYDFDKLEIIVVDNNEPTDTSLSEDIFNFVKDKKEIKYAKNNNQMSLAGATNMGIDMADSKHFIYLCSNSTYIYDNQWLKYMINEMSDADYAAGVRLGGTRAHCGINGLTPDKHYHAQGSIFIAFTDYMKKNKYGPSHPFSFMDVFHSADCLRQGFLIKELPRILACMAHATPPQHDEFKQSKRYYIAHLHNLENYQ